MRSTIICLNVAIVGCSAAFAPAYHYRWGRHSIISQTVSHSLLESTRCSLGQPIWHASTRDVTDGHTENIDKSAVRAPLKFVGPYPCFSLRFPDLATSSQRARNATGVSLDFVLDTAANTNTINAQVAAELKLEVVGEALPGVGAGGAIVGGDTYMLGNCEIDGLPPDERFIFMSGLTASALPVASPSAAGLLGIYFFNAFHGGVDFTWGGDVTNPLAVTFYSDPEHVGDALSGLQKVDMNQLPGSGLPAVKLNINGVEIPALLDTGSPITVLNAKAAKMANVRTANIDAVGNDSWNPFSKFAQGMKTAQAAARGEILMIADSNGNPVSLLRSDDKVDVNVGIVRMGKSNIYVGDLPGLAALGGLGGSAPPAAILGMDVLRLRPRMLYRKSEVYL